MSSEHGEKNLSGISTLWSVVSKASLGTGEEIGQAQRELLQRYSPAIFRYLVGAVRDADVAEDLAQEFALRLIRGDFRGADPARGRFRDFVKGVLYHLVADYQRRKKKIVQVGSGVPEVASPEETDREFLLNWRGQLLSRAWDALARVEQTTGQRFHAVLRLKVDSPEMRSQEMAEMLSQRLGKPVSAEWVRQNLHRAREKFADFLVKEILDTLDTPTFEALEQELIDLELHEYCLPALNRLRPSS